MPATKVTILRMETSRTDHTKWEHFVCIHNDKGEEPISLWMRHKPEEALHMATDLATFLGVPLEPLVIGGVVVELDSLSQSMLQYGENGTKARYAKFVAEKRKATKG